MAAPTLTLLAYVLSNLIVILACLTMAGHILPRLWAASRLTVSAGILFFVTTAAQHVAVTYAILFGDLGQVGSSTWFLFIRMGIATSLGVLAYRVYLDLPVWRSSFSTRSGRDT